MSSDFLANHLFAVDSPTIEELMRDYLLSTAKVSPLLPTVGKTTVTITGPGGRNQPSHWATEKKEHEQVATNNKAYSVLIDGEAEPRVIEANEVQRGNSRIDFVGSVEGHDGYGGDIVASFPADRVLEYRTVPVPEEPLVGKNTFRLNLTAGGSVDVQADRVLRDPGSESTPAQYTLVTSTRRGHEGRTEYVIAVDKVESIARVTEDGTVPAQATSADVADAKSLSV